MGWYIALAILLFLAWLPLGVWVQYENKVLTLKVLAWFLKIPILPAKEKKPKKAKKEKPKKQKKPKKTTEKEKKKWNITIDAIFDALDLLGGFVARLGRRLHMKRLEVALVFGGEDPANTAILYGKGCAMLGALEPAIDNVFHVKHKKLSADVDFLRSDLNITATVEIRFHLGMMIAVVIYLACRGLKLYKAIKPVKS